MRFCLGRRGEGGSVGRGVSKERRGGDTPRWVRKGPSESREASETKKDRRRSARVHHDKKRPAARWRVASARVCPATASTTSDGSKEKRDTPHLLLKQTQTLVERVVDADATRSTRELNASRRVLGELRGLVDRDNASPARDLGVALRGGLGSPLSNLAVLSPDSEGR